jgi:hypothetical protein
MSMQDQPEARFAEELELMRERHKPSYRSMPPFGCPPFTYVQLSR